MTMRFYADENSNSVEFDALVVHQVLYPALCTIHVDSRLTGLDCMETTELRGRGLEQLLSFIHMWRFEFEGAPAEVELWNPEPPHETSPRSRDEFLEKLDSLERLASDSGTLTCEGQGPCLMDDESGRHHPHSYRGAVRDLSIEKPLPHQFSYHPRELSSWREYWEDRKYRELVILDDDFIYAWIYRAVSWIHFPAKHSTVDMHGLAMTGVTWFHPAAAKRFGELCREWSRAIGELEPVFPLEVRYYTTDNERTFVEGPKKEQLDRDEICQKLDSIAEMAEKSLTDGGQIVHWGL